MSFIDTYSSIKLQALSLRAKRDQLSESLKQHRLTLVQENDTFTQLSHKRAILLQSIDVVKQLIDKLSQEQILALKELLSYGLKTIFSDHSYSVDILISESRSVKQAQFILIETLPDGSVIKSEFKDSIGGGILSIVGLIIQVYYILYFNQYPIIFMDEALSQVSSQYIPSLLEFIMQLSQKKDFHFVLVSHDQRLIDYGTTVYSVQSGVVKQVKSN